MIENNFRKKLVNIEELSEYIGYSSHTVYGWISEKRLPFPYFKFSKRVKFDLKDVDKWVESRKIKN
ncbi:MAG: helix-turn-helix domain-containing protein [Candidatus Omnitrophica bacterium]|nr:helix-turn-helix domain-containing protein [Candidatus Omnitrophota bacterium]